MASASRRLRKIRRMKRERTLAYRAAKRYLGERNALAVKLTAMLAPKPEPDAETTTQAV